MQGLVNDIREKYSEIQLTLNCSIVAYRDFGDGNHIDAIPFTQQTSDAVNHLQKQVAAGGGDLAEDVLGGLEAALALKWTSKAKFLVLISDAPGHGSELNDGIEDDHPSGKNGLTAMNVIKKIKDLNIEFMFGKINESTNKMISTFKVNFELFFFEVPLL